MTDRADEIARDFYSNLCTRKYMADTIRAYGDERVREAVIVPTGEATNDNRCCICGNVGFGTPVHKKNCPADTGASHD